MVFLMTPRLSEEVSCPYLDGKIFRQEYFHAHSLSSREFQEYLDAGWRRFGTFFFRPQCPDCRACQPLRVKCGDFKPSKSQKRCEKKNQETGALFRELQFREEIFRVYQAHREKFPSEKEESVSRNEFIRIYYQAAVPAFQSEYYREGILCGAGFLDKAEVGLSSIYFCYDPAYSSLGLGNFSILKEIELCRSLGLVYYYLGYFIEECPRMSYKGRFGPYELLDWDSGEWR